MNKLLAALLLAIGVGELAMLSTDASLKENVLLAVISATLLAVCAIGLLRGWRWAKNGALVLLWLCAIGAVVQAAIAAIALTVPPVASKDIWLMALSAAIACGTVAATAWLWRIPRGDV
jgi:hypothetical protein